MTESLGPGLSDETSIRPTAAQIDRSQDTVSEFTEFYLAYKASIVAFLMFQGASFPDAAEIAQDAMCEAYKSWPAIDHPKAWTRRVASRAYLRRISSADGEILIDVTPEVPGVIGIPDESYWEERHEVLRVLRRLTPRLRQVLAWTIDGFTPTEIAEELGMKPEAVRQALLRARSSAAAVLTEKGVCDE